MTPAQRKAAAITAAIDAIEGEPGGYVTWATRRHLEALYDRAVRDGAAQAAAMKEDQ